MTELLLDNAVFKDMVISKNKDNDTLQKAIFDLLAFSNTNAERVEAGKDNASFHHVIDARGPVKLFYVFCSGYLEINPNWGNPFVETSQTIEEREIFVRDMIAAGFSAKELKKLLVQKKALISINNTLTNEELMKQFQNSIIRLQNYLKKNPPIRKKLGTHLF